MSFNDIFKEIIGRIFVYNVFCHLLYFSCPQFR